MPEDVTMWSESLYEGLYAALRANKPDAIVKALLQELTTKGHPADRIEQMVKDNVSIGAGSRVKRLLGGAAAAKRAAADHGKKGGKRRRKGGFFAWLKSLFG